MFKKNTNLYEGKTMNWVVVMQHLIRAILTGGAANSKGVELDSRMLKGKAKPKWM